jgi:hypothetical protein
MNFHKLRPTYQNFIIDDNVERLDGVAALDPIGDAASLKRGQERFAARYLGQEFGTHDFSIPQMVHALARLRGLYPERFHKIEDQLLILRNEQHRRVKSTYEEA